MVRKLPKRSTPAPEREADEVLSIVHGNAIMREPRRRAERLHCALPTPRPTPMLRIVTLNLNGIRSACRKGFLDWIHAQQADVVCVQEVKAHATDLDDTMRALGEAAGHFHFAQQKGYSGVGLYARRKPKAVRIGFGCDEFDGEGRYVEADFGTYTVISLYVPSGSSSPRAPGREVPFPRALRASPARAQGERPRDRAVRRRHIAHKEIDLRNWRSNQKNSGFLPEERAWLSKVFDEHGWVDVFRRVDPNPERYTWWSNRGQAWAKNVGWRLDYQIATPGIASKAKRARDLHGAAVLGPRAADDRLRGALRPRLATAARRRASAAGRFRTRIA